MTQLDLQLDHDYVVSVNRRFDLHVRAFSTEHAVEQVTAHLDGTDAKGHYAVMGSVRADLTDDTHYEPVIPRKQFLHPGGPPTPGGSPGAGKVFKPTSTEAVAS
jgi:hypothetical protein